MPFLHQALKTLVGIGRTPLLLKASTYALILFYFGAYLTNNTQAIGSHHIFSQFISAGLFHHQFLALMDKHTLLWFSLEANSLQIEPCIGIDVALDRELFDACGVVAV